MQASDLARSNALALLARHARTKPTAVAFRSKHLGIYRERTWRDYAGLVARAAAGLKRLGVMRGERVAIMGDPCEEWMLADLGAQAVGAISYGIYPTASASEVEYQLRDAGASVFVAQDQEYVDRILPFADRLPAPTTTSLPRWRRSPPPSPRAIPPSSSTPRARPATPRAPWSRTAGIWPAPTTWCSTIRSWPSHSAPWSTCRSATCWDATSR